METVMFLFIFLIGATVCRSETFVELYSSAVESYRANQWEQCFTTMEKAILAYKEFIDIQVSCRIKCKNLNSESTVIAFMERNNCIRYCASFHSNDVTNEDVRRQLKSLQGYDYVQICAYKSGNLKMAVSAAYTFSLAHPEHEVMKNNIQFYRGLPDFNESDLINLESKPFKVSHEAGVLAYQSSQWEVGIVEFERAAVEFVDEVARCEALCEMEVTAPPPSDVFHTITELWKQVVNCSVQCFFSLTISSQPVTNASYLAEIYNYLQYSYYKVGQLDKAAECVESNLLLLSNANSVMVANKAFYLQQTGLSSDHFVARQEAVKYVNEKNTWKSQQDQLRHHQPRVSVLQSASFPHSQFINVISANNSTVLDGLVTESQSSQIVDVITRVGPLAGQDLTLTNLAFITVKGDLPLASMDTTLNVSETVRYLAQQFYHLPQPLLLKHAQLACDSAVLTAVGPSESEFDMKTRCVQPVQCQGSSSSLSSYGVILFLNDNFEGGQLFYKDEANNFKHIDAKPGRVVSWPLCDDVCWRAPVSSGMRCTMTFTMHTDLPQAQSDLWHAQQVMQQHKHKLWMSDNGLLQKLLRTRGYRITRTEMNLHGPERFAAEGMATQEQCDSLINMANKFGIIGDGYQNKRLESPHTNHEKFAGITVTKAAEMGGLVGDGYKVAEGYTSPHTVHEKFEGLSVARAAQLAVEGKVEPETVRLYLTLSAAVRELVHAYFRLTQPLYFDYTHLVCRTALDDSNTGRTDLSHPVHSDNCIIQPDGSCRREHPAYVERDYSALLYLSGNFTGGDFFFANRDQTVQASLHPTCGMMVGFNASNYHGVKAVLSGQRCAVALWFTLDSRYKEVAHDTAWNLLKNIKLPVSQQHSEL